jgi:hypothetical protein
MTEETLWQVIKMLFLFDVSLHLGFGIALAIAVIKQMQDDGEVIDVMYAPLAIAELVLFWPYLVLKALKQSRNDQ